MITTVGKFDVRGIALAAFATAALSSAVSGSATAGVIGPINTGNYTGPVEMQYNGFTTGNASANYGTPGNEVTWGAGFMTSIYEFGNSGNLFYSNATANPIGYVIYGLADGSIISDGMGGFNIYNIGCTGGDCDGSLHIDFYELPGGSSTNFGTTLAVDNRTGFGDFTGITDIGTLLMGWEFLPGIQTVDDPGTPFDERDAVLVQNVSAVTLPATGDGDGYAECTSGPACALFQSGNFAANPLADFFIQFSLSDSLTAAQMANGWEGRISDPVEATVIPEPSVLAMFGFALMGLGIATRRRKTH